MNSTLGPDEKFAKILNYIKKYWDNPWEDKSRCLNTIALIILDRDEEKIKKFKKEILEYQRQNSYDD